MRKYDIISRYGGDEFVIILEDVNKEKVSQIAQRIIEGFYCPFMLNGQEVFTSPSIGISFILMMAVLPRKWLKMRIRQCICKEREEIIINSITPA